MPLQKTVISHFYNEGYLMRWWIEHHLNMFDHGILIDYNSTDDTRDIINQYAPHWTVVNSRNSHFSAVDCDAEVMDIENSISGWKIALNTTEFLCCEDLDGLLQRAESDGDTALVSQGVIIADPINKRLPEPDRSKSLVAQHHFGFFEADEVLSFLRFRSRERLLHCRMDGAYRLGRHETYHTGVKQCDDLLVLWFGFGPWTEDMIARKLNIKHRIPQKDRELKLGFHHLLDYQELEILRQTEAEKAQDLRNVEVYRRATKHCFGSIV
ncbi:Glycosyl transferase family 2 [Methylobacterium phyllostachyos]|uniref:Glycosyl transferase family 2 n=1 Tax=Methylobacterium phyllostachyos TaxID=582672 RepID=A0A1G9WJ24_9HYPH|nr:glycosyltransferase family 2 protein [Methylobacterium phyllostachyos]SDM84544.1 Glycosyl transferase family 2 [Methylobacterium phyllostachyos]